MRTLKKSIVRWLVLSAAALLALANVAVALADGASYPI